MRLLPRWLFRRQAVAAPAPDAPGTPDVPGGEASGDAGCTGRAVFAGVSDGAVCASEQLAADISIAAARPGNVSGRGGKASGSWQGGVCGVRHRRNANR